MRKVTLILFCLLLAACSPSAPLSTSTPTVPPPTETPTILPTDTPVPTATQAPTVEPRVIPVNLNLGGVVACKIVGDITYTDKTISFEGIYVLSSIHNGTIPKNEIKASGEVVDGKFELGFKNVYQEAGNPKLQAYSSLMKGEITADEIKGTSTTWVVNRILKGSENKEFSIKLEP